MLKIKRVTWRRKSWRAPLAMSLVLALAAAGCGQSSQQSSGGKKTLVVWAEPGTVSTMQSDPNKVGKYGKFLEEQFEKAHPDVDVKLELHGWDDELRQNLTTALLAGTAPDVIVGENYFQQYASLGALVPLDDVIGDIKDNLIPGTIAAGQVDGKTYALPAFTGVFGFERNCAVVTAAGLDCNKAPATWDELLSQANTITQKGGGKYYGYTLQGPSGSGVGSVFRIAALLGQSGAPLCKDDCTKPNFNDPKAIPAYEFLRKIYADTPPGLAFEPDEGKTYGALFQGKSAFQIAGSWHTVQGKSQGCKDCRYSTIPLPTGGHESSVVVGNVLYAVLKQSKNVDLAKEWVKSITTDEAQKLAWEDYGRLPATKSALEAGRKTAQPADQQYIDILLHSKLEVLPQWRKDPQRIWQVWNDAMLQVLKSDKPIADILNKAQADAEQIASGK